MNVGEISIIVLQEQNLKASGHSILLERETVEMYDL